MIDLLVRVAREKIYDLKVRSGIKLIMDCLEGCTREQAFKILTGELNIKSFENGIAAFEEGIPEIDIVKLLNDSIVNLATKGKDLVESIELVMKKIIVRDKKDVIEISYSALFKYYFYKEVDDLHEEIDNGELAELISIVCKQSREFLEYCHDVYSELSYMKRHFGLAINCDDIINISSKVNITIHELCTDSNSELNSIFAKNQFMKEELNKFIECGMDIEHMRKNSVIHPIDITAGVDAGWLAPNGNYYGLNGAVANFLHIQIADMLKTTHRIYPDADMPADAWMARNGWVKIHHDEVYYDGYIQSKHGYQMVPLTDVQKARIAQYGKAVYGGVLKFGMNKQECNVSKFQQMDEFAVRKLFDFV